MLELFDESHYFICTGGMKPACFKANQNIARREDGKYYLTKYSLRCKGIDFACKWAALLYAIIAAAMALLMASGVGWILLAAIIGAAIGAGLGAMMCGDMAAILRTWEIIKTDAEINTYSMVPNRPGVHMSCKFFGNQITFAPNVKNEFTAICMFAGNIVFTGLEGFMYVYGARGVGLLVTAPKKFLCNFATNYLASLTMKGVAMRSLFAGYSATNAYYTSSTEGFDGKRVGNAALDGGFFVERAAWRLYQGVANDGYKDPVTGKTNWGAAINDATMMAAMGGIPAGGGGKDATPKDVSNMANQVASEWRHPAETAKAEIGKVIETAKQFREQLKKLMDGTGTHEGTLDISKISSLEELFNNPELFKELNPAELYQWLKDMGYNPQPLAKGSLKGIPFEEGGGFKVNLENDGGLLQYHPSGGHHGGVEYWKISSGKGGTHRYDMNGNIIDD